MSILSEHEQRNAMVRAAARKFRTTPEEILSSSRSHVPTAARWYAWALIRAYFGDSYPRIGRRFNKDHTSVMNGIARYFGYKRPTKNTSRGTGLAVDVFLALNAEQLKAEAEQAIAYDEECKMNYRLAHQSELEEAVLQAQLAFWKKHKDMANAA